MAMGEEFGMTCGVINYMEKNDSMCMGYLRNSRLDTVIVE